MMTWDEDFRMNDLPAFLEEGDLLVGAIRLGKLRLALYRGRVRKPEDGPEARGRPEGGGEAPEGPLAPSARPREPFPGFLPEAESPEGPRGEVPPCSS